MTTQPTINRVVHTCIHRLWIEVSNCNEFRTLPTPAADVNTRGVTVEDGLGKAGEAER